MMQAGDDSAADPEQQVAPASQENQTEPSGSQSESKTAAGENSKEHSAEKTDGKKEKKKTKSDSAAKLAFLEKKYKEVFTENNARKDEMGKLVALIQDFLNEIDVEVKCQDSYEFGDVAAYRTAFVDGWVRFRKKAEVDKRRADEEAKNREKLLHEELAKEKADAITKREQAIKETKSAADKVIKNLEELNSKLQNDSNNLLNLLKAKEAEILEVREANLLLSNKATDSLMVRFEKIGEEDLSSKIEQSSRVDEIIRLRNELDEAHEKIDTLEAHMAHLQKRKQSNDPQSPKEASDGRKLAFGRRPHSDFSCQTDQDQLSSPFIPGRQLYGQYSPSPGAGKYERLEEKLEKDASERKADEEESSRSYLKNLVVRYLIFEAKRNDSECNVLRRAILDCLKINTEERASIDDAINNRGGLKDSVYFLRIFGNSA